MKNLNNIITYLIDVKLIREVYNFIYIYLFI